MATPVKIDNTTVNSSTGSERPIAVSGSNGRKFAAIFGTSGTNCQASPVPTTAARMLTSKLSKIKSRNTLARHAQRDLAPPAGEVHQQEISNVAACNQQYERHCRD